MKWFKLLLVLIIRPWYWKVAWRFVPNNWWRRPPFLPIPPKKYIQFRMETAYGDKSAIPSKEDFIDFLAWAKRFPS